MSPPSSATARISFTFDEGFQASATERVAQWCHPFILLLFACRLVAPEMGIRNNVTVLRENTPLPLYNVKVNPSQIWNGNTQYNSQKSYGSLFYLVISIFFDKCIYTLYKCKYLHYKWRCRRLRVTNQ